MGAANSIPSGGAALPAPLDTMLTGAMGSGGYSWSFDMGDNGNLIAATSLNLSAQGVSFVGNTVAFQSYVDTSFMSDGNAAVVASGIAAVSGAHVNITATDIAGQVNLSANQLNLNPVSLGFFGAAPVGKTSVGGDLGGSRVLTELVAALAQYGLIYNDTTNPWT